MTSLVARRLGGLIVVLSILTGCHHHEFYRPDDGTQVPLFRPRTSPANLLRNLLAAYDKRNVAEYESLLAADFVFEPCELDAEEPGFPDSWGRPPEVDIHRNLFDPERVSFLDLAFTMQPLQWDETLHMWSILVTDVHLRCCGIPPTDEPSIPQIFEVSGLGSRFWFRETSRKHPVTHASIWEIARWADNPPARLPPELYTWGKVKLTFRSIRDEASDRPRAPAPGLVGLRIPERPALGR